ncbi:ATP-binding protein [uncultured Prevotella sp.]|uniref:ATP-binding protein n=1 Tax=uncultured Prevotella sp. TaxID=159272 RepID=UPI0025F60DE0|nr:ATP-binding protein [uncultured Prevotella sp.]
MINLHIRRSLSAKLSLSILLLAIPIFVLSLGILFVQSRNIIKKEAMEHAKSLLNTTMQRLDRNMMAVETATDIYDWEITENLQPDSLLALTRRVVTRNPHVDGCSISMEPDVFPQIGRYFSVYTVRETDTITSVIEQEYEYFEKIWYKTPHNLNKPCWVTFFDESDSLELTISGLIASYGKPIYSSDNQFIGVISSDISLIRLSKDITAEKPYPNSYFMMLGKEGHYFIHPDSTKLFTHTIFDDVDPREQADLIALGHEMTAGNQGSMAVVIDGTPCLVCYQPMHGTEWSLAIVCPESDILNDYHALANIIALLIAFGLLLILIFCHRAVAHAIRPINQLLTKTQTIASGNYEVHIPKSNRNDVVGRLQNSFATMLQSLNFHMGSIRYTAEQTENRNQELLQAMRLAEEADRNKTTFIQNVTHQIRTPLNIIMGFSQVLRDDVKTSTSTNSGISEEEMNNVTYTMKHNARILERMVHMLFDSSATGITEEMKNQKYEKVSCNEAARESIRYINEHFPSLDIKFNTEVADNFCIKTNRTDLLYCLSEILYNSAKYSDGQHIQLHIGLTDNTVQYICVDTGKGIPEADRDHIFEPFTKADDLSEGLGLGLPLTKNHVLKMGGTITLDTSYHDGCRFIIELPR